MQQSKQQFLDLRKGNEIDISKLYFKQQSIEKKEVMKPDSMNYCKYKPRTKIFKGQEPVVTKVTTHRWNYGKGYTPSQFKIATWNINGVRRAVNQSRLQEYIKAQNPDIICLQQTKICEEAFNKQPLQIPSYQGYWNFCKCSSGYSGVAILSKYKPIRMIEDFPQNPKLSQEGRVITLQFKHFYLITVYVPLSGLKLERIHYRIKQWDPVFQEHCEQVRKSGKMVIICGDMNVVHKQNDMHRRVEQKIGNKVRYKNYEHEPGCTQGQKNSFSLLLSKGWIDTFRYLHPNLIKYSWWNGNIHGRPKNIGRRLDYMLVNRNYVQRVADCIVRDQVGGSDHCPVQMIVKIGQTSISDENNYIPFANNQSKEEQSESQLDYDIDECVQSEGFQQVNDSKGEQANADFCHLEDASQAYQIPSQSYQFCPKQSQNVQLRQIDNEQANSIENIEEKSKDHQINSSFQIKQTIIGMTLDKPREDQLKTEKKEESQRQQAYELQLHNLQTDIIDKS